MSSFASQPARWIGFAVIGAIVLALFVSAHEVGADETTRVIFLEREFSEISEPSRVVFVTRSDDGVESVVPGVVAPSSQVVAPNDHLSNSAPRRSFFVGAKVPVSERAREIGFVAIAVSAEGIPSLSSPGKLVLAEANNNGSSPDELRKELLRKKEEFRNLSVQVNTQEESLRRLRADAGVVADLGRIVEVREQIEQARADLEGLEKDRSNLQDFVRLARSKPAPRNFVGRERQLVKHLGTLVDLTKDAETTETQRRGQATRELQRKVALIESTRSEDFESLQRRLIALRKQRMDLEAQLGVKATRPDTPTDSPNT